MNDKQRDVLPTKACCCCYIVFSLTSFPLHMFSSSERETLKLRGFSKITHVKLFQSILLLLCITLGCIVLCSVVLFLHLFDWCSECLFGYYFVCSYLVSPYVYTYLCMHEGCEAGVNLLLVSVFYKVRHLTFFQIVLISWLVTLSSCLIWQIISFILPPNEHCCVYTRTRLGSGPAIDLQKMPILAKKNHLFRWSLFWSWRVCKQAKFSHFGAQKPRTHTLKSRRTQNESLFGADFGPQA